MSAFQNALHKKNSNECPLPCEDTSGAASCSTYGCGGYVKSHGCQCNSKCGVHKNCCADYLPICVNKDNPTPVPLQTTAVPVISAVDGLKERAHSNCRVNHLHTYSDKQLRDMMGRNCQKVRHATNEFGHHNMSHDYWTSRGVKANALCDLAVKELTKGNDRDAAELAITAWGAVLTNNSECCVLSTPPYCLDSVWFHNSLMPNVHTPLGVLFVLLAMIFLCSGFKGLYTRVRTSQDVSKTESKHLRRKLRELQKKADFKENRAIEDGDEVPLPSVRNQARTRYLAQELRTGWTERSCLRALPGAQAFALSTATLFEELCRRFDFQDDNVRNQHEHLISLWRSHCAIVADRQSEFNEDNLLAEALADLHSDLLHGFRIWRARFRRSEGTDYSDWEDTENLPELAGAQWKAIPEAAAAGFGSGELSRYLAEISIYLLVWGEAGNLRFMPECIYFITELALTASRKTGHDTMNDPAARGDQGGGLFLSRIIRPIYNVIFEEWYEGMDQARDRPRMREGYNKFLPADSSNYDDWDELFYDPEVLKQGLVLQDGDALLFESDHEERFAKLDRVDWRWSLHQSQTKTHREVHSLWGFFATTHRIWLLHSACFMAAFLTVCGDPPITYDHGKDVPLLGRTHAVRFAFIGLLVPLHALFWSLSRIEVLGTAFLRRNLNNYCLCRGVLWGVVLLAPLATYTAVRYFEIVHHSDPDGGNTETEIYRGIGTSWAALFVHYIVTAAGFLAMLLHPGRQMDRLWPATPTPLILRGVRYLFWFMVFAVKFCLALMIVSAVYEATVHLNIVRLEHEPAAELLMAFSSGSWSTGVIQWSLLWLSTFFLFLADTQMWFVLGCSYLGTVTAFVQRGCLIRQFATEDTIALIPERFIEKVLHGKASAFPPLWNRIVSYMKHEDKCGPTRAANWSYTTRQGKLQKPVLFKKRRFCERFSKQYCPLTDDNWPENADLQWRFLALSRGLGLPMPRPFEAPYFPGLTVLIPHYSESVFLLKERDLLFGREDTVPLIDWLTTLFGDEFEMFINRMHMPKGDLDDSAIVDHNRALPRSYTRGGREKDMWDDNGSNWDLYKDHQWDKICTWASMRMQTLYRTAAGMCLYHPAIQAHYDAHRVEESALAQPGVWDATDCFTCLISMQRYTAFNSVELMHTNHMFEKLSYAGKSLKVAFIDPVNGRGPNQHPTQVKQYYSCVMDGTCEVDPQGKRKPIFRVELPGYPILGDGKGDNQNHAIIFSRGVYCQCIDANQGAYFEQMLLLPCVLGEFRTNADNPHTGGPKSIIGFPEHITSDIGSIGDFAAGSEVAFGTILQRSYAVLGARMHYGHPDLMQKCFMMQQGGVSKATKTLNLSEDIFAGMDFTLRGQGRQIRHCEYFNLAKGRDLGFNSVLGFFCKLSSGAGEQIITRQMFRLGQIFHLPEVLTFYYAHVGYYVTQAFVSWSMPILVFTWLLVLVSDCENTFRAFMNCPSEPAAMTMARMLSTWFSWLMIMFLIATSFPLLIELTMQRNLKDALKRIFLQFLTCSPLVFIFQAKIIGYYVMNELRYGGAAYVATGRGLPTERRDFVGKPVEEGYGIEGKGSGAQGLYLDYVMHTYYDGMHLLGGVLLIIMAGGVADAGLYRVGLLWTWICLALTIVSWLYAPFIFNPYMFNLRAYCKDVRAWWGFFFVQEGGMKWVDWYETKQIKPKRGHNSLSLDLHLLMGFFGLLVVVSALQDKLRLLATISATTVVDVSTLQLMALMPPIGLSTAYCMIAAFFGCLCRKSTKYHTAPNSSDGASSSEAAGSSSHDEEGISCRPPLAFSAIMVCGLSVLESLFPLLVLFELSWWKALTTALILKFYLFEICIVWGEAILCSTCFPDDQPGFLAATLQHFVRSTRLVRDIITSSLILAMLTPFVLLNKINETLCPGCSIHQLLIYRAPNVAQKRDEFGEGEDSEDEDIDEEAARLRPVH